MTSTLYQTLYIHATHDIFFSPQSSFDFPKSGEARATFTNVIPNSTMRVEILGGSCNNFTVDYEEVNMPSCLTAYV